MPRTERERLAAVAAIAALCVAALVLPGLPQLVTVPAAVLLILLLPGYAVTLALFPSRAFDRAEQLFFTLGLSFSVSILAGLLLNALPVGLTLSGWGALLGALTVGALGIAWLRIGASDRAIAPLRPARLPRAPVIMVLLAAGLVLSSLMIARMGENAQPEDGFTQLWMLPGANGAALQLGVTNHEGADVRYELRVTSDTGMLADWSDLSLADGQSWDQTIVLPALPAGSHEIAATLYRDGGTTPYREARVAVTADATQAPTVEPGPVAPPATSPRPTTPRHSPRP